MGRSTVKGDCIACVFGCGINASIENGKLISVDGMPEHPLSQGFLCPRGRALVDYVCSRERLKYPLKKVDGDWERIFWDETLDTTAERLQRIKDEYGAHALAIFCGSIGVENNELASFAEGVGANRYQPETDYAVKEGHSCSNTTRYRLRAGSGNA